MPVRALRPTGADRDGFNLKFVRIIECPSGH